MGIAIAWSLSTAVMAMTLLVACRRLVGLDPSLSSALGFARRPVAQLKGGVP